MIDTNKYEGHTPGPWKNVAGDIYANNEHIADTVLEQVIPQDEAYANTFLIADAPLLLAEVKRLRKLEAAVVGSWMKACDHRGPWHKALRYPCVELGYLTLDGHYFELSEEYQDMAKEWIREQDGDEEE